MPSPTPVGGATDPNPGTPNPPAITPIPGGTEPQPGFPPQPQPQPQPQGGGDAPKLTAKDVKEFWAHSLEAVASLGTEAAKKVANVLKG